MKARSVMPARRRRGRAVIVSTALAVLTFAAGLLVGSGTVAVPGLALGDQDAGLRRQVAELTAQKDLLAEKLAAAEDFQSQIAGTVVDGTLTGKSVVLLRTPDAAEDDIESIASLVGQAGGSVTGTVSLTEEFVDANSAEKLDSVVNSPIVPPGAQLDTSLVDATAQAGDLLGIVLLTGPEPGGPTIDDPARETVLATLRETGFLSYGEVRGGADAAVVVTGGALGDDAGNRGLSVARLAAGLGRHGSGAVLAGETGSSTGVAAVAVARADPELSRMVTTIDDVDSEAGRMTVILAVRALIDGAAPGSYGAGQGASAISPR